MRLAPRPRTALVVFALYLLVFCGVWQLTGVAYNDIGDSARTIAKWYVAPLAAGAVVLVVAVTVLGWWRPALFEVRRATPRWLSRTTTAMLGLLVVGSLLVGFCEELATRGVLVVGFRGSYNSPRSGCSPPCCSG